MSPHAKAALIVGGMVLGVLVFLRVFEADHAASDRPWTDPPPVPESLAPELAVVPEAALWSMQPVPMCEPCVGYRSGGMRQHRTFAGSLAADSGSLVQDLG